MGKEIFRSFSYVVDNDFVFKDKRRVYVFFIYHETKNVTLPLMLKKVEGKNDAYYIDEAKKIIDQKIKDGSLMKDGESYLKKSKRKKLLLSTLIPFASVGAIAGISVGTYYAIKGNDSPTPVEEKGDPTKPLTLICEEDGSDLFLDYQSARTDSPIPVREEINLSYQIDDGDWTEVEDIYQMPDGGEYVEPIEITTNLKKGQEIHLRGNNDHWNYFFETEDGSQTYEFLWFFNTKGKFSVANNVMSLISSDDFANLDTIPGDGCFTYLFSNSNATITTDTRLKLVNAKNLILPATTLKPYCYQGMFIDCSNLITSPKLPAPSLTSYCYYMMFSGCSSLKEAPELSATTLAPHCYQEMFFGCGSLTKAPQLPAETLEDDCYSMMFRGCTSLTEAPLLRAKTLKSYCYNAMFAECSKLNITKDSGAHLIFTCPDTSLATESVNYMFVGTAGDTSDPVTDASYYYN